MKMIDVKKISFKYQDKGKIVLNNMSFSCEEGSVNVLIGLNGSGKTTLIKVLAGLFERYCGDVFIDGCNLKTLSIKERSIKMAYVAQRSGAIDDFSVFEYLSFGRLNKMSFYQCPSGEDKASVLNCANDFEINHLLDKKLCEISGGERQIVSICSALVQDTKLVILDEPTSALDIKNQHVVLSIIKKIAKEQGKTFILSTHNPNHALYLDGNVLLLKDGKIVTQGQACEVVTIDCLRTVYGDDICRSLELPYEEISFRD